MATSQTTQAHTPLSLFYCPWNGACSKYYLPLCFIPPFIPKSAERRKEPWGWVTFSPLFSSLQNHRQRQRLPGDERFCLLCDRCGFRQILLWWGNAQARWGGRVRKEGSEGGEQPLDLYFNLWFIQGKDTLWECNSFFSNTLLHMEATAHFDTYLEITGETGYQLVPAGLLYCSICRCLDESQLKEDKSLFLHVKIFSRWSCFPASNHFTKKTFGELLCHLLWGCDLVM